MKRQSRLKLDNSSCLAFPERSLRRFAYHCETGGIPTGIPIQRVIESIASGTIPKEGCQARFLFCSETMDAESGIEVVNLMNEESVQSFFGSKERSFSTIEEIWKSLYPDGDPTGVSTERQPVQHATIIKKLDRILENLERN